MKKNLFLTVTAATMILVVSCGQKSSAVKVEAVDLVTVEMHPKGTEANDENTNRMESYRKVLLSEDQYFDVGLQKNMYLKDYWIYFSENIYGGPMRIDFTVVDMDGDGVSEVVIMYDPGEVKVFRVEGGTVYGYDFSYRGMMNLKKDGTFYWSNDADASGIGRQTFSGVHTETITLTDDGSQDNKEDVDWLELTGENIELRIKN